MALIINGETIDDEIIEEEFRHIKGHYERALQVSCCERDPEFRGMAKDNLASRALLQQESRRRFPEIGEEETKARLEKLIEQSGGEEQFYMSIGMPFKDESLLQDNLANGVRMDKMLKNVYSPEPEPAEADIQAYYEANVKHFLTEEQIRVSHISLNLSGARSRAEVYQNMRELREQALAGADFNALGAEHNSNKDMSPDLGWFKKGEFMEEFEAIAFSMRDGEISPVFTTQLGFHICRLAERKPAVPKPLAEVREAVVARILEEFRDGKFNEFLETLKDGAKIEDTEPEEECGCGGGHC
ncbi:peptidylprolyl isomerase [Verrucomicrobium sp. BvORR106]|uniref:peptidylprolyl isomerase n=1 Tax=Verrucomicrobium sp. BvORR106 TaxID=1403819 RepID=UPI000570F806|nr:peptidylprolyl isomerase [Verrucomicrobium sp. BvORR106]